MVVIKPESIVEKTGKVLSSAVKKLMTPEEEDEEAAYDRADDLVRPDSEAREVGPRGHAV